MSELKDIRKEKKLTQQEAANLVGISIRSYKDYENIDAKKGTIKYQYILEKILKYKTLDEEHGILTIEEIKKICSEIFNQYDVNYCYLFGSYAKGKATPSSDVDLLISCNVKGLKFYGLTENLREKLHKRVDLLETKQLKDNLELTEEILRDGIKVYGK